MAQAWRRSAGVGDMILRSAGGKASRRWRARRLVACLEDGAEASGLKVSFGGVEDYAEEYVERSIFQVGAEEPAPFNLPR